MSGGNVIAIANEKGGVGKSTLAAHIAVQLLHDGKRVAWLDLDRRQASLRVFFHNRRKSGFAVAQADELDFEPPTGDSAGGQAMLEALLNTARGRFDHVMVDTPGQANNLHKTLLRHADVVVTPVNDSFIDLSALTQADTGSTPYASVIMRYRRERQQAGGGDLAWSIVRNRLSSAEPRNRKRFDAELQAFAAKADCRILPGLRERVIFRELFPLGLTVTDLSREVRPLPVSLSHIAARAEIARLVADLHLVTQSRTAF